MSIAAILFLMATGLVTAGLTHSLWVLASGETPSLAVLTRRSWLQPVKAVGVVFAAPLIMLASGFAERPAGLAGLARATAAFAISAAWCFILGVAILAMLQSGL